MGVVSGGICMEGLASQDVLKAIDLRYAKILSEKGQITLPVEIQAKQILHSMVDLSIDELRQVVIQEHTLYIVDTKLVMSFLIEDQQRHIHKYETEQLFEAHFLELRGEEVAFTPFGLDVRLHLEEKENYFQYTFTYLIEKNRLETYSVNVHSLQQEALEEELM